MRLDGNIISGEYDETSNEFSLQQVKQLTTDTTLNTKQVQALYDYLQKCRHETDGQVITLYDQVPLYIDSKEIELLLNDLEKVKGLYS